MTLPTTLTPPAECEAPSYRASTQLRIFGADQLIFWSYSTPFLLALYLPSLGTLRQTLLRPMSSPSPIKPGFLQPPIGRSGSSPPNGISQPYRPAFAGPSTLFHDSHPIQAANFIHRQPSFIPPSQTPPASADRQVIDLTGSPSPPPVQQRQLSPPMPNLPHDLPPKTPVCIGQLAVTALVLYPIPYLGSQEPRLGDAEWATVQLRYEHNPNKPGGSETIHIMTPRIRAPNGEAIQGEGFGVVEQRVATHWGPCSGRD
jgi:SWI/SNF-related matrix-associated actin-dependent regulator of chromatin subfamily A3